MRLLHQSDVRMRVQVGVGKERESMCVCVCSACVCLRMCAYLRSAHLHASALVSSVDVLMVG